MLNLIKLNPSFGQNLYNAFHPALFYISFFLLIIALVGTIVSSKKRLDYILLQILISAIVLFVIKSPDKLLDVGEFTFNLLYSLLKDININDTSQGGKIIWEGMLAMDTGAQILFFISQLTC